MENKYIQKARGLLRTWSLHFHDFLWNMLYHTAGKKQAINSRQTQSSYVIKFRDGHRAESKN
jgi:hypothetical protein